MATALERGPLVPGSTRAQASLEHRVPECASLSACRLACKILFGSRFENEFQITRFSNGLASSSFRISGNCEGYVVRVDQRSTAEHFFDCKAISIAAGSGILVQTPVAIGLSLDAWTASVYTFIQGEPFKPNAALARQLGKNLARLHDNLAVGTRASVYRDAADLANCAVGQCASTDEQRCLRHGARLLHDNAKQLERLLRPNCLTHGDIDSLNLIVTEDSKIGFIDFEKACSCSAEMELVQAIMSIAGQVGYESIGSLTEILIENYLTSSRSFSFDADLFADGMILVPQALLMRDMGLCMIRDDPVRQYYLKNTLAPSIKGLQYCAAQAVDQVHSLSRKK